MCLAQSGKNLMSGVWADDLCLKFVLTIPHLSLHVLKTSKQIRLSIKKWIKHVYGVTYVCMGSDISEQVRIGSDGFRKVWIGLDRFRQVWVGLDKFGQIQIGPDRFRKNHISSDRFVIAHFSLQFIASSNKHFKIRINLLCLQALPRLQ